MRIQRNLEAKIQRAKLLLGKQGQHMFSFQGPAVEVEGRAGRRNNHAGDGLVLLEQTENSQIFDEPVGRHLNLNQEEPHMQRWFPPQVRFLEILMSKHR